jgi:CheY-like chemotaxis protein
VEAANGLEALRILNELTTAAIVFNLEMPHLDGFAFAAELRRQGRHSTSVTVIQPRHIAPSRPHHRPCVWVSCMALV